MYLDINSREHRPNAPVRVLLNGEEVMAIAADDENRWVEVIMTDDEGNILLRGKEGFTPRTKILRGNVEFIFPDE